ncbi:hypothetical protein ACA910_008466 [Epithemia clementina (nom. ined.)]
MRSTSWRIAPSFILKNTRSIHCSRKCACTYFDFQSRISLLKTNPGGIQLTFDDVVSQLSEAITSSIAADPIYQQQQRRNDRHDIYSATTADSRASGRGRGGGRNSSGCGRGHGRSSFSQSRKRTVINGVDCTDLTRWYSNEEFFKLPVTIQNSIKDAKAQRKRTHAGTSNASTTNTTAQQIVNSIQTILSGGNNESVDDVSALPLDSGVTTAPPSDQLTDSTAGNSPGDAFGRHAYGQHTQKRRKQGQVRILQRHIASTSSTVLLPPPMESYC